MLSVIVSTTLFFGQPTRAMEERDENQGGSSLQVRGAFSSVPKELIVHIFSFLPIHDLYMNVRPLSKDFKAIAEDPTLWKKTISIQSSIRRPIKVFLAYKDNQGFHDLSSAPPGSLDRVYNWADSCPSYSYSEKCDVRSISCQLQQSKQMLLFPAKDRGDKFLGIYHLSDDTEEREGEPYRSTLFYDPTKQEIGYKYIVPPGSHLFVGDIHDGFYTFNLCLILRNENMEKTWSELVEQLHQACAAKESVLFH